MPKSDSWPGRVTESGMDSAGSCDSVLSINSAFSDDSLEYLSAEERACLIFLEETIESLEVGDDSGLSNDEVEHPSNGLKEITADQTPIYQNISAVLSAHEDPNQVIGRDHKASQKYHVPTPLVLASGNAKIVKPIEAFPKEPPLAFIDAPDGFRSSPDHQQPKRTFPEKAALKITTSKPNNEVSSDIVDLPPSFIPEPPVRTSLPSDSKTRDAVHKSLDVKSQLKDQNISSEVPLEFIPPPSDFMDKPAENIILTNSLPPPDLYDEPPEWIPELPKVEPHASAGSVKPTEVTKSQTVEPEVSKGPLSPNEIEKLRKKASLKKAPHLTPIMIARDSAPDKPMTPSPSSEHAPPKSPPTVAPKPKKLPSNIILKSHKDSGATHSLLPQSERTQIDPQKIRMEALKKLGLLKNEEVDGGPGVSPSQSPTFRTKTHPQSPSNPKAPAETIQELSRLSESPVPGDVQPLADTLKHQDAKSREGSCKKLSKKSFEIKSASLERGCTGPVVDPVTQMTNPDKTHVELSPGQLRKSRTRPPSVGSAKDFGIGHQSDDVAKPLHAAAIQGGHDGQKLPRHNGISVMISPHSQNGEDRREALKKLGLLKD